MTPDAATSGTAARLDRGRLKSLFVNSLFVSLGGTALLGIGALTLGEFGDTEFRVLLTTLLVGLWSVLCLGCLATFGRPHGRLGLLGLAATSAALALGTAVIWLALNLDTEGSSLGIQLFNAFCVAGIAGFALTHAGLLLNVARPDGPADRPGPVRAMQVAAVAALTAVAVMCMVLVYAPNMDDGYFRLLGVFAILDVVGTVFTVLAAKFGRARVPVRTLSS